MDKIGTVLTKKKSKSFLFLLLTIFSIIALNAGLPLIQGQAHYTVNEVEMTYGEYLALKEKDQFIDMTYGSKVNIILYKSMFAKENPDLTVDEIFEIEPPSTFKVKVFTAFFFVSAGWWIATAIGVMSGILVFYAVRGYFIADREEKDEEYLEAKAKVKENNQKYIDPNVFEPFMNNVFNRERKIKQHISNVKYDISVLNEKTPVSIKNEYKEFYSVKKNTIPVNPEFPLLPALVEEPIPQFKKYSWFNFKKRINENKKKKYFTKMREYEFLLDPKYIEEIIPDSKVKYFKHIQPGFVYSGINKKSRTVDEYSTIETDAEHTRKNAIKRIFNATLISIGFASMFTVAGFTTGEGEWYWYVLNVITKLAPLILQWLFAIQDVSIFFKEQVMPNLMFRQNIQGLFVSYSTNIQKNKEGLSNGNT